ncbi:lipoyltransferase [Punctularia strigosozonata HHB-11173 SS5]|uniref:lipoyltransferase n=1 Tax=Punctularia strigosozonata (strain HHB-11173) TaxID=741275 RepID=UPI0004416A42|nr:lipoyltransferase [Punctularia strigosozonata HHB-11173 SS5]EIN13430.1 lipoyltransferase [Punctularia strigosozonata HHB-11173 SS5]
MVQPIFYHCFRSPLPYARTLALQERIHRLQLDLRSISNSHQDVLLLLQHRPVFTAGRRQTEEELSMERARLTGMGADFEATNRGGQLTYHGPGQIIGYPLIDLSRWKPSMRVHDYICNMQNMLKMFLKERHGIQAVPSEHTGVFAGDGKTKMASIGVQVRHRLTSHGFSINVTDEPLAWFNTVVACGLADVKAGSIEGAVGAPVRVDDEMVALAQLFGRVYGRDTVPMDLRGGGEVAEAIAEVEAEADSLGLWHREPQQAL